jgi:hypothetical protein
MTKRQDLFMIQWIAHADVGNEGERDRFFLKATTAWRKPMLRFRARAAIAMLPIFLASYFGPELASTCPRAHAQEKTIPQGEDPPGTDEEQTAPPTEHKGVIPPPPVGDEDIYTKVPNPEAGHEKEVIPPPGTPGGDPNVEPR